jgi:metallo-beta-lactamase class B
MMIKTVFELLMMIAMGLPQGPPPRDVAPQPVPVEPFKVVGNIYFVGPESEHSSFLITTPQGHILINTGFDRQVPTIRASIEKLGFKVSDIKIILGSHAHVDHQEGDAQMKELTGAQVMAMAEDVPLLKVMKPKGKDVEHPIDRVFHDKDTISLGGVTLTAILTPGHTPGCTTYMWKTQDAGKTYDVVFGCGFGAGGRKLVNNKEYPTVIEDYKKTYAIGKTLHADVFLGSHGNHWGLMDKLSRMGKGTNPFIDATTLPKHVDAYEKEFYAELAKQEAAAKGAN